MILVYCTQNKLLNMKIKVGFEAAWHVYNKSVKSMTKFEVCTQ